LYFGECDIIDGRRSPDQALRLGQETFGERDRGASPRPIDGRRSPDLY
jgi:hypothetical protein